MAKLKYLNIAAVSKPYEHGTHAKDMMVLHETVSPNVKGWSDIASVEAYLHHVGYAIHGLTDNDGNIAWAYGLGNAIFYHCGGVNTRAAGIEQISNIPTLVADGTYSMEKAKKVWYTMEKEMHATAMVLAAWHNVDPKHHPLSYSNGLTPGVTSHWDVSQHYSESQGHTDCHPAHKGGYYPILEVIQFAKNYAEQGLTF